MNNNIIKIIGIALLSAITLTGCSMDNPKVDNKTISSPSSSSSPSTSPSPSPSTSPSQRSSESDQTIAPQEKKRKVITHKDIKDVDIDLLLEEYTDPEVFKVFPADEHYIDSGASIGLGFIDALNTYEGFYKPRNAGDDAKFFAKKEVREIINDKAFEIFNGMIATDGRAAFIPSANLNGDVCLCDGTPNVKLDGVPEGIYDMPIMVAGKSSQNLDRLVINVDRTVFFKGKGESPSVKQTFKYYVFLSPSGKTWKVSGMGFNKVGTSKIVNNQGDEI